MPTKETFTVKVMVSREYTVTGVTIPDLEVFESITDFRSCNIDGEPIRLKDTEHAPEYKGARIASVTSERDGKPRKFGQSAIRRNRNTRRREQERLRRERNTRQEVDGIEGHPSYPKKGQVLVQLVGYDGRIFQLIKVPGHKVPNRYREICGVDRKKNEYFFREQFKGVGNRTFLKGFGGKESQLERSLLLETFRHHAAQAYAGRCSFPLMELRRNETIYGRITPAE